MKKYTVLVNGMVVGVIEASPAEVRHLEQDKTIVLIARQSPEGGIHMNTKSTLSKEARTTKRGTGDVSPFSALTTALAATILCRPI